ncbi:MAG: MazG nucleotide pyrophosphohydrolase domain-containing protein [Patescibacteria group bacterium]
MLHLKENPTLKDIQEYVTALGIERGFDQNSVLKRCLLLGEEMGELFKAVRKKENMKVDHHSEFGSLDEELADVIIVLCSVVNYYRIDLEKAFREKEEINKKREWK